MRKKSHISLAKGVINGLDIKDRINHRLSFYIGSIWPDCIPSFITRRHCIEDTFDIFNKNMEKFVKKFNSNKDMSIRSTWRMGVMLHYIADYFTFPHNKNYTGNLKDHCVYEEELKHCMYKYVDNINADKYQNTKVVLSDLNSISDYIKEKHAQYKLSGSNVEKDCKYSVLACMCVMASLLNIVSVNKANLAVA